jgi:hypothetical protein
MNSTILVPELQHWVNQLILGSTVNKQGIPIPVNIDELYMPQASFIEMLFNDNYSHNTYKYLYVLKQSQSCMPYTAFNRLQIYPNWKYAYADTTGVNLFGLVGEDLLMLNALLQYRIDSTSLNVIDVDSTAFVDSTAMVYLMQDTTANVWYLLGNPNLLTRPLAKLIYIYLNFIVNGTTTTSCNTTTVTGDGLLTYTYEIYVIEKIFAAVSARGI